MQKFASVYDEDEIFPQGVGKLSWRSNGMLLDKLKTKEERLWYVKKLTCSQKIVFGREEQEIYAWRRRGREIF